MAAEQRDSSEGRKEASVTWSKWAPNMEVLK